jgi:transcriptional regulator with XRE-family HTH domain
MPFWQYLRNWMREHGRTQGNLAEQLGLHQTVISRWLHPDARRRAHPARRQVDRLSTALGIPVTAIIEMIAADPLPEAVEKLQTTERNAHRFVEAYGAQGGIPDPDLVKLAIAWPRLRASVREAMLILAEAGRRGAIRP